MIKIITSGKRKRAVARAVATEGSGRVTINKKPYETLQILDRLKIEEPLRIAVNVTGKPNFDVAINVKGGGRKGASGGIETCTCKGNCSFHQE